MELVINRLSKQYKNKIAADRISVTLHREAYTGFLAQTERAKQRLCGLYAAF